MRREKNLGGGMPFALERSKELKCNVNTNEISPQGEPFKKVFEEKSKSQIPSVSVPTASRVLGD
jgi:hypothetical protein